MGPQWAGSSRAAVTIVSLTSGLALASSNLAAQTGCTVTPSSVGPVADVCQKANDIFRFLVPQVGVAVAAGNPVPGEGGTMGGWGRRAFSLRLIGVDGQLPSNTVPLRLTGPAVASEFGASRSIVPLPALDAAIGLTEGVPLGLTNVGGVDVLLGVTALPKATSGAFSLDPKDKFGIAISYGARLGLLQESSIIPGVSVSYMRRKLPKVDFGYRSGNDTLSVAGTSVLANSIRVVASKRIPLFGLAVGVGRDEIEGSSSVLATVNEQVNGVTQHASVSTPLLAEKVTRTTAFVNASVNLLVARVVAEFGWSNAGAARPLLNTFGGHHADEGYRYGSIGLTTRF
jgi:hypothetical protein